MRQVLTLREVQPVAGRPIRLDGLPTRSGLKHQFRTVATGLGLLLCVLGAVMLSGWWLGRAPAVKANAALATLLLGGAVLDRCRRARGTRPVGMVAGTLAALIGVLTLVEDFAHLDLGIDTLLAPDRGSTSMFPGRMSLFMAVGMVLLGTAAALISRRRKRGRLGAPEHLALCGLLLGLAALLGHIYHTGFLLTLDPSYGSIAVASTACLLAGALALLLLQPNGPLMRLAGSTSFAGREARRLIFIHTPALLAIVLLVTQWQSTGALTGAEAAALCTMVFVTSMLAFGWRAFRDLDRAEFSLTRALKSGEKLRSELQAEVMQRTTALTATSLKAEAARAQLQAVVESAPDLVAAIDTEFNYVVANRAYLAAFRDDHGRVGERQAWERALAGERFTSEDEIPQPDDSVSIYERSYGPVKDGRGRVIGAVGLFRNITARRVLEQEAMASRRLLETVLHHSPAGIFVKDSSGHYLLANPVFGRMTGLAPSAIPGCRDSDLFTLPVAEQARLSDLWALERGAPHEREVVLDLPEGGRRNFLVSKAPMPNGRGGWWLCGIATDITERKLAEAALQRSELDLAGRNRDLETLLHVISHDLKEPLRSIESFSSLLAARHADQLDPKGLDFLERVVKATGRLGQLLTEIQLLSRARRAEPAEAQVDGGEVVREVLERLDSAIREASATVQVDAELPSLKVERVWATQALYNLVANALKFRRPGAPVEIQVTAWRTDGLAGFQVLDRGPGVPPDQSERIFELFQRGVGREVPGTGAGLAIVRQIAERHGGRAWVEPRQGGGSVFTVTFASEEGRAA